MLNVSEELKNILKNDRFPLTDTITPKDLEIIFDGMDPIYADQIVDDTFELTESIISDDDIRFGTCRASQIKFKLANVPEELKGREFTINQLIGDEHIIPLGKFKVESAKLEDDLIFKEVIAYDKLKDTDVNVADWYNSLFPDGDETYTLKQFRSSLLAYLGVEEVDQTLPNDGMVVTKTIEPTQISGRTVLEATVELNGAFGHINRQGKFVRIVLSKLIDSIPEEITKDIYMTVKFEEYEVKPVDKLQVRSEEDDIGAIYGEGINTYVIQGNFLLYGKTAEELQTIAENVSANIFGRAYRPYTVESIGLPYLEIGDAVEFATDDAVVSYILQRTLKGIQVLKDEFEAPGGEEREQNFGVNNEILQIQGRYARIKKDVDGIVQTVGDIEQGVYTEIEQLADQLVLKIDADGNIGMFKLSKQEDGTQVLIKADNIELEGLITANGNFKVLEDGSIESIDGKFSGSIIGSTITGGTVYSLNFFQRDENGNIVYDSDDSPIESGLGAIINLDNGFAKFLGEASYQWLGESVEVHKAFMELFYGYLRLRNEEKERSLYITSEGITTDIADVGSGTISFFDNTYKETYRGITVQTKKSPVALRSLENAVFLNPEADTSDGNMFVVDIGDDTGEGRIRYGKAEVVDGTRTYACGLRFSKDENNPAIWVTDGTGSKGNLAPIYASNIMKPLKTIGVTKSSDQITKLDITYEDDTTAEVDVEYNSNGDITKVGDTSINY